MLTRKESLSTLYHVFNIETMKRPYRVYRNGVCVALGCYHTARAAFIELCAKSSPFADVVLLVNLYMQPIDSF